MVSLVISHTNTTRVGWHQWEIDLKFAPGLPPGWMVLILVWLGDPLLVPSTFPQTGVERIWHM